jgi:hypothetical protein
MLTPVDVFADMVLSSDGEEVHLKGKGERLMISFPTLVHGIRSIRSLLRQRQWIEQLESFNSVLKDMGLSLYFRAGPLSIPLLGLEASQRVLPTLKDLLQRYSRVETT